MKKSNINTFKTELKKYKVIKKKNGVPHLGYYYQVMIKKWFIWIPCKVKYFDYTRGCVLKQCFKFDSLEDAEKHLEEIIHSVDATAKDGGTIKKIFNYHGKPIYLDNNGILFNELTNALNNDYENLT